MERIGDILARQRTATGLRPVSEDPSVEEECPICKGAHFVHPLVDGRVNYSDVTPCRCVRAELAKAREERYLRLCQLPVHTEHMTLESFVTNGDRSLIDAQCAALQLADDNGDVKWLTLLGQVDRGKTHLAVAICRRWLARKRPARYTFVPLLLKELRDGFDMTGEYSYRQRFDGLCNIPMLVLDDLGVERSTEWAKEQLQTIVHYRGINCLPLVVTSNRPLDELVGDEEHRIASRLQRETWCRVVVLKSGEHRLAVT